MPGFMYLKLSYVTREDEDDIRWPGKGVCVSVVNEAPRFSLGGQNSRQGNPGKGDVFAYFKIDDFDGLECIETNVLFDELLTRMTVEELLTRTARQFTDEQLIALLTERLGH